MILHDKLARALACAVIACLAGCASQAQTLSDPLEAGADARLGPPATSTPADPGDDGSTAVTWGELPETAPPPRCALRPSTETCRPGGFPCDVVHGVVCCGSCIDGLCCAAREQPCSDVGPDTCCDGLRCGSRCVCE